MTEITWIVEKHKSVYAILNKYIPVKDINDIVSSYTLGHVHIGRFDFQEFTNNYITYQIKYMQGLTFIDFWRVESYDGGSALLYPNGWNVEHYSFIYKNMKLYREKINNFLLIDGYDIMGSGPSMPIYDMDELSKEQFVEFTCQPKWINVLNKHPISDNSNQKDISNLFNIFITLTENLPLKVYEKTTEIPLK